MMIQQTHPYRAASMRKFFAVAALLAPWLLSCEADMSVGTLDHEARLVVYCMPTCSDTTVIQVTHSVPLNGQWGSKYAAEQPLSECNISYTVNQEPRPVHHAAQAVGSVPAGAYYVVGPQQAGDRVTVSVQHYGYPAATGSTVIPQAPTIGQLATRNIERVDKYGYGATRHFLQMMVSLWDDAASTDYYAVQVEGQEASYSYGEVWNEVQQWYEYVPVDTTYRFYTFNIDVSDEPLLHPLSDADDEFLYENDFFSDFYIFDDRTLPADGSAYTLHLNVSGYNEQPKRIALYRLTPEFYRFVRSINDARNNGLAEYGLSTIAPTQGNVEGGLGFVGGYNVSYTGYTTPPQHDNIYY